MRKGLWVRVLGIIISCFITFTGHVTWAQSDVAVVVEDTASTETGVAAWSDPTQTLLSLLKQVNLNFSTIHFKELQNNKGKTLILPLTNQSSDAYLNALSHPISNPLLLVPMITQPHAHVERFLERMGFHVEGSQYIPRSLPLSTQGKTLEPYLPIGTFALRMTANAPAQAHWGRLIPAALHSGKNMLLTWNWANPLPPETFQILTADWSGINPVQPQQEESIADSAPSSDTAELVKAALKDATIPQAPTSSPSLSTPSAASNSVDASSVAAAVQDHAVNVTAGPTETSRKKAASESQPTSKTEAAGSTGESYPDDLYEFSDGKKDKARTPLSRSTEIQAAMAEFYNDRMRELGDLQERVGAFVQDSQFGPAEAAQAKAMMEQAAQAKSMFENEWFKRNFGQALSAYEQSKSLMMKALFNQVPNTQIEGRALWLDRGTIVKAGSAEGLRSLIRRISDAGFNIIYFETINAGFPIYPSTLIEQNPDIRGWDPLAVAVDEAHKNGVELHAWVWAFAVGNTRHNVLINKPSSYPGPILSKPEMASEALRGRNGELVPAGQHEYWLSPASSKARQFLTTLYSEIVQNYDVDGLQLDYIRYPFQKPFNPMGYEGFATHRFSNETGLDLSLPNEFNAKAWTAWKAFQVTTFVQSLSEHLKGIKPNLKLSAAVFPIARHNRMSMIQQDWETWVREGWIDTLNPMAYSRSSRSLEHLVDYIHTVSEDRTLVYPGLSLQKLNAIELLDTLEICRQTGVMGTTLFAAAQLDNDRQVMLESGPYKDKKTLLPHRDPLNASIQLLADTQSMMDSVMKKQSQKEAVRNIQASLTEINDAMTQLQKNPNSPTAQFLISNVRDSSLVLEHRAEDWADNEEDQLAKYQALVMKQMVDKVVRMVNYTTFQLAGKRKAM